MQSTSTTVLLSRRCWPTRRHPRKSGDETSADFDSAVFDAAINAFGNSGKPLSPIGGLWIYGSNDAESQRSRL